MDGSVLSEQLVFNSRECRVWWAGVGIGRAESARLLARSLGRKEHSSISAAPTCRTSRIAGRWSVRALWATSGLSLKIVWGSRSGIIFWIFIHSPHHPPMGAVFLALYLTSFAGGTVDGPRRSWMCDPMDEEGGSAHILWSDRCVSYFSTSAAGAGSGAGSRLESGA